MNTFFKFHLQAWMLLAVAAGIAVGHLAGDLTPARPAVSVVGAVRTGNAGRGSLPAAGNLRSIAGALRPTGQHWTLDGAAFLEYATPTSTASACRLADDATIIHWLRTNTTPDDVILEAQLPEYQWGSRLSVHSGRPTVLGYRHHQRQQRPLPALADAIELRRQNIAATYETTDLARKIAALRHYDVRYVAVGGLERAVYPTAGLAAFDELVDRGALEVAWTSGADRVYRVPPAADSNCATRAGVVMGFRPAGARHQVEVDLPATAVDVERAQPAAGQRAQRVAREPALPQVGGQAPTAAVVFDLDNGTTTRQEVACAVEEFVSWPSTSTLTKARPASWSR